MGVLSDPLHLFCSALRQDHFMCKEKTKRSTDCSGFCDADAKFDQRHNACSRAVCQFEKKWWYVQHGSVASYLQAQLSVFGTLKSEQPSDRQKLMTCLVFGNLLAMHEVHFGQMSNFTAQRC